MDHLCHFPGDLSPFCLIFQFFVGPVLVNTVVPKSLCQLYGFGRCGFLNTDSALRSSGFNGLIGRNAFKEK